MDMSGQDAPVSQPETVLLETPSESATSCWVIPLDFRNTLKNSPMFDLIPIASRVLYAYSIIFGAAKQDKRRELLSGNPGIGMIFPEFPLFGGAERKKSPPRPSAREKGGEKQGVYRVTAPAFSRMARRLLSAAHSASTEEVVLSSCTPTPQQPISPSATPR